MLFYVRRGSLANNAFASVAHRNRVPSSRITRRRLRSRSAFPAPLVRLTDAQWRPVCRAGTDYTRRSCTRDLSVFAPLHTEQFALRLPCGHGLQTAHRRFSRPCAHGLHAPQSRDFAVRAPFGGPPRALLGQAHQRLHGLARLALVLHLAVGAPTHPRAVAPGACHEDRGARRAVLLQLAMRAAAHARTALLPAVRTRRAVGARVPQLSCGHFLRPSAAAMAAACPRRLTSAPAAVSGNLVRTRDLASASFRRFCRSCNVSPEKSTWQSTLHRDGRPPHVERLAHRLNGRAPSAMSSASPHSRYEPGPARGGLSRRNRARPGLDARDEPTTPFPR